MNGSHRLKALVVLIAGPDSTAPGRHQRFDADGHGGDLLACCRCTLPGSAEFWAVNCHHCQAAVYAHDDPYVDAVLLRPLPVPDSGRIVEVDSTSPDTRLGRLSYADYVDLRDHTKTLRAPTCYDFFFAGISTQVNQVPKYSLNASVSGNFFSGLRIQPVLGRGFLADEDTVAGGIWWRSSAITCGAASSRATVRCLDGEFA